MDSFQTPNHEETVKKLIGRSTYEFLNGSPFSYSLPLLVMSEALLQPHRGKIQFPVRKPIREYSYLVAPAAKGFEGFLLALSVHKGIISNDEVDSGIPIGAIFAPTQKHSPLAEKFLLKPGNKHIVGHIYAIWDKNRNKVLHYDPDFFVKTIPEADKLVKDIFEEVKLAYQVFIGDPNPTQFLPPLFKPEPFLSPRFTNR